MPNKEIKINASALKYTYCDQAYAFTCLRGLVQIEQAEPLNFGIAVHAFCEAIADKDIFTAFPDALKKALSLYRGTDTARLKEACMARLGIAMPNSHAGLVERYFEIPYGVRSYHDTHHDIFLCGTIDHIALIGNRIHLYDYKTSRVWDKEKTRMAYAVSTQMYFYTYVVHSFPERFSTDPTFITAAKANRIDFHIVPCFLTTGKNKTTKELNPPEWEVGVPNQYSTAALLEYEEQLNHYIDAFVSLNHTATPMRNGIISDLCSDCNYCRICHSVPEDTETIIESLYVSLPYNPDHSKV